MELIDGKWHWTEADKQKKREVNQNLMWITNEIESWRILKTDPIPVGFRKGRVKSGLPPWNKGIPATEESNAKRREAMLGRPSGNKGHSCPKKGITDVVYFGEEKALEIAKKKSISLHLLSSERSVFPRDRTVWSKLVKERDHFTCQHCGNTDQKSLRAHHIKSWEDFLELRFVLSNGVTLCFRCHDTLEDTVRVFSDNGIVKKSMFTLDETTEVCSTCHRLISTATSPNIVTCQCQLAVTGTV